MEAYRNEELVKVQSSNGRHDAKDIKRTRVPDPQRRDRGRGGGGRAAGGKGRGKDRGHDVANHEHQ